MSVHRAEVVHISILAPRQDVIAFLSDVRRWKSWALWARSVERLSANEWTLQTDVGSLTLRFVEPNSLGVLDHVVTLPSGATLLNSMRVLPNGDGSELVMVLFQSPSASSEEFERDVQAVREDLARIKNAAEALPREGAR
jgi:polyketide cyclase/dehydrase/lipid transport protein